MNQLILAVLSLALGAGLCLLNASNRVRAMFGLVSQAIALALVWSVAIPVLLGGPEVSGGISWAYPINAVGVRLDALGAFFLVWSLPMTLLGSIYAVGYLKKYFDGPRHVGVHFALLNMIALSFVLVYTGNEVVSFLFGWEVAALAAWQLVIWDYTNQRVRFAGFNYLVSTHIGLLFLVAALMILYAHGQSWDFEHLGRWLSANHGPTRNVVFLLLVTSFGLKSAFFPFHSWLPRAHAAAPAHVSALMSGVIHKAGLYALVRFTLLMGKPDEWMGWFLIAFSVTSALIGGLYTVGQRDLKRLLGYSSTENVGIAGIGFGIGCLGLAWQAPVLVALGFGGGLLHVLNHAFFKCLLFYSAGCVYQVKHVVDVERLGGLFRLMPVTGACFLIGGVAISAMPPFNGFASEFVIYSGLFGNAGATVWAKLALAVVGAALAFVGAVSALSITRAFGVVFLGNARDSSLPPGHEASRWMLLPMGLHALGTVVLGVLPAVGFALVIGPVALFMSGVPGSPVVDALAGVAGTLSRIGLISGALVAAVVVVLLVRYARVRKPVSAGATSATWGCGYTLPNARMQYSGASFSSDFSRPFKSIMVLLRRQKAPAGYFPRDSYVVTDCVDAVERRLFNVIDHGDDTAIELSRRLREDDPRVAFAAGLAGVMIIAVLVLLAEGALR